MSNKISIGIATVKESCAHYRTKRCFQNVGKGVSLLNTAIFMTCVGAIISATISYAAECDVKRHSQWEPLLWGGNVKNGHTKTEPSQATKSLMNRTSSNVYKSTRHSPALDSIRDILNGASSFIVPSNQHKPNELAHHACHLARLPAPILALSGEFPDLHCREPFRSLALKNIPPLYLSPKLPGEGVWNSNDMPKGPNGWPAIYQTSYRPSTRYPNAVVHMLIFDIRQVAMRLYVGSSEPGANLALSRVGRRHAANLLAITNGLWKRRHSHGAGAIFNGKVLGKLASGMATIVVYKDHSVDIVEWDDSILISNVLDARQLKHLIVKNGKVVDSIIENGRLKDSEIGLGYLLVEEAPVLGRWGPFGRPALNHTHGEDWFIATRSAFGIRPDGNVVFAAGHHISTKDLAKSLVLAGCVRGIHGDANPHNVLGNLYYTDQSGAIVDMARLSPEQKITGLSQYIAKEYTSDFFAFFKKQDLGGS